MQDDIELHELPEPLPENIGIRIYARVVGPRHMCPWAIMVTPQVAEVAAPLFRAARSACAVTANLVHAYGDIGKVIAGEIK